MCFSRGFHFFSVEALYADNELTFTVIAQNTVMFVYMSGMSTFTYSVHKDYDSVVLAKVVTTNWWFFCVLEEAIFVFALFDWGYLYSFID